MDSTQRAAKLATYPVEQLAKRLAVAETALESVRSGTWSDEAAPQFASDTLAQMDRFIPLGGTR